MGVAVQLVVVKPFLADLGGEGLPPHERLVRLETGRVLEAHEVAGWGRSVDALVDQGKLARMPKVPQPAGLTDEQLLAELAARGLHAADADTVAEPAVPKRPAKKPADKKV